MTIWLGQDGYDYGFQVDYKKIWQEEIEWNQRSSFT